MSFRAPLVLNKVIEVSEVTPPGLFIDCTLDRGGEPTENFKKTCQTLRVDISKASSYIKPANLINKSRYLQKNWPMVSLATSTKLGANDRFETCITEPWEDDRPAKSLIAGSVRK